MKLLKKARLATIVGIALVTLMAPGIASAGGKIGGGSFGLGLGGGTMVSGLSAKYYMGNSSAIQAVIGGSGWGFGASVDYAQDIVTLARTSWGKFNLYAGAGGAFHAYNVGADQSAVFGAAGIVGLNLHFTEIPLELATEWRPAYTFGDYVGGLYLGGAGGGIRWYF